MYSSGYWLGLKLKFIEQASEQDLQIMARLRNPGPMALMGGAQPMREGIKPMALLDNDRCAYCSRQRKGEETQCPSCGAARYRSGH